MRRKYTPAQIRRNRIIALMILALVVVVIIAIVMVIRSSVAALERWQKNQAAEDRAYQIRMEERTFEPPKPCAASNLKIALTPGAPLVYVGTGEKMAFEIQNASKTPCTVVIDPRKSGVQIVSGNQIVYNSTSCQPEKTATKQLLLAGGKSWKQTLNWDGMVHNSDCSPATQVARAGTYRSQAIWDGVAVDPETVLALQDPPPPSAQTENSGENPAKTAG
ncbi:Uncharacterised protein [Mobiluncus mulieris]|uniref:DUF4232 domain-containing protein n=1 Tax=Mobiluncus mulieris TaxID=2052 RepID=A0A8G2HTD2_9ACTO|nr:Uncharacterised protein [Mobiluncus mulieris]